MQLLEVSPERRDAFMAETCGDDVALREDLIALLQAHDGAAGYFDGLSEHLVSPALLAIAHSAGDEIPRTSIEQLQRNLAHLYRIERELGGAGMSRVFVAEEVRLKRRVVIKVLPSEMVRTVNAVRFQREIELAAQLQHPHIVPLLTADTTDGTLYYTMPFVAGESLRDRLARDGPLPLGDALRIWRDILDALAHAHASDVVHRDIKPGNILLSGRHALVTDFGIAVAIATAGGDTRTIAPGLAIGTPAYMAPEQVKGARTADHRVDLYAAGVVMYEMLAGRAPFKADSTRGVLELHLTHDPPALSRTDVPARLVALVMRCLSKDPAARPLSANAALAELDETVVSVGVGADRTLEPTAPLQLRRVGAYSILVVVLGVALLLLVRAPTTERAVSGTRRRTPNSEAYEWYRKGMDPALLRTDSGNRRGVEYFNQAIAIDSTYAEAWAGLAKLYLLMSREPPGSARRERTALAMQAANKAVALDDSSPEALAALGWVRIATQDYDGAEAVLKRAIALDPALNRGHEGLARIYMLTGRHSEQLARAQLAIAIEPKSYTSTRELALALLMNGECDSALKLLRPLKEWRPPIKPAGVISGQCYAIMQKWPEAIAEFRWSVAAKANSARAFLGYSLARAGQRDEAQSILSDLLAGREYSHGAFGIAIVYAGLRDYDQAFAWLDKAVDEQTLDSKIMQPMFADLHQDPRFARLKRRLGVLKPWTLPPPQD